MTTAKLFKNGRSQAVRIPKEYRFEGEEVMIKKQGKNLILMPVTAESWDDVIAAFNDVEDDFMAERTPIEIVDRVEL